MPQARPSPARPRARPIARGGKVERIVRHCVFEISTGAWAPGSRLPSLRAAEELWSVNHLTVLRAYRRLVELGLVRSRPRSGYFVAPPEGKDPLRGKRAALERIYADVKREVGKSGLLSTAGVLRTLARLAESRLREEPECAFVECTRSQAEGHAREIEERLAIPCAALTLDGLADAPEHLRCVVTTGFHRAEVVRAMGGRAAVLTVSIELPAAEAESWGTVRDVLLLAVHDDTAAHMAADATHALTDTAARVRSRACDPAAVAHLLDDELGGAPADTFAVLLSPTLWSAAPERHRADPRVHPLVYRIAGEDWPRLAGAFCLPSEAF